RPDNGRKLRLLRAIHDSPLSCARKRERAVTLREDDGPVVLKRFFRTASSGWSVVLAGADGTGDLATDDKGVRHPHAGRRRLERQARGHREAGHSRESTISHRYR